MKKTALLLSSVMALTCIFVGCGSKSSDEEEKGLVGKWEISEESLKAEFDGEGEYTPIGASVEFTEDNKVIMKAEVDYSDSIKLKEETVIWGKDEVPYTYDGKTITVGGMLTFDRIGDADESSSYGDYTSDYFSTDGKECVIHFESADKTTMEFSQQGTYEYNEDEGTITSSLDEEGEEPSKVEIDGDTLKLTDEDGTDVYTRVK